jgi:hypothetical protein
MSCWFSAIQKVNIWNKVLKGLIPILLSLTAVATLPEQNGTAWFIEKTIEKEEKENSKTEQADIEEESSYDNGLKKNKSKKKLVKVFSDISVPVLSCVFTPLSCFNITEKQVVILNQSRTCPFYILCHQQVFYEG